MGHIEALVDSAGLHRSPSKPQSPLPRPHRPNHESVQRLLMLPKPVCAAEQMLSAPRGIARRCLTQHTIQALSCSKSALSLVTEAPRMLTAAPAAQVRLVEARAVEPGNRGPPLPHQQVLHAAPAAAALAGKRFAPFAMCTIPKVGCTNFRKLLAALVFDPEPLPRDAFSQYYKPHIWKYPSVWHYKVDRECPAGAAEGAAAALWRLREEGKRGDRAKGAGGDGREGDEGPPGACMPGRLPPEVPPLPAGAWAA